MKINWLSPFKLQVHNTGRIWHWSFIVIILCWTSRERWWVSDWGKPSRPETFAIQKWHECLHRCYKLRGEQLWQKHSLVISQITFRNRLKNILDWMAACNCHLIYKWTTTQFLFRNHNTIIFDRQHIAAHLQLAWIYAILRDIIAVQHALLRCDTEIRIAV